MINDHATVFNKKMVGKSSFCKNKKHSSHEDVKDSNIANSNSTKNCLTATVTTTTTQGRGRGSISNNNIAAITR